VILVGDRQHPAQQPQHAVFLVLLVRLAVAAQQPVRGDQQYHREQVEHPAELGDRGGAHRDEHAAQGQRHHHADQQHACLMLLGT